MKEQICKKLGSFIRTILSESDLCIQIKSISVFLPTWQAWQFFIYIKTKNNSTFLLHISLYLFNCYKSKKKFSGRKALSIAPQLRTGLSASIQKIKNQSKKKDVPVNESVSSLCYSQPLLSGTE